MRERAAAQPRACAEDAARGGVGKRGAASQVKDLEEGGGELRFEDFRHGVGAGDLVHQP